MHDEHLREGRFDKPSRAEQGGECFLSGTVQRGIGRAARLGAYRKVQEQVGQNIEQRTDRPEPQHEAHHRRRVPCRRTAEAAPVHIVPRDGGTSDVVCKIEDHELQREHGQEGQKRACRKHGDHIAEVGGRRDLDIFHQIEICSAPLRHALCHHGQVLFQKDDVRGVLGDVRRRIHRNADVGGAHGGRIVDAVPHIADHMPLRAQQPDDACLLRGGEFCEDGRPLRGGGEFLIRHFIHVGAEQDLIGAQPHLAADIRRDLFVVAREHFDGDARLRQATDGSRRRGFGRIEKGEQTHERHVALVLRGEGRGRVDAAGKRKHAHPLRVQAVCDRQHTAAHLLRQLNAPTLQLRMGGNAEHLLHGALGHEQLPARAVGDDHAHPAPLEIEGDLVRLAVGVQQFGIQPALRAQLLGARDDGGVHQIFQSRLMVAVQPGIAQNARVLLPRDVKVHFQHDFVLRDGARLVRAQHVHRAQILDGVQIFDDDLLARHCDRALGKTGRNDHGQHLGREPHGNAHGKQPRIQPVPLGQPVDEEYDGHHDEHEADEQAGDCVHTAVERRF